MAERIGLIGAGMMGKGIAKNLRRAGHAVVAHKRNPDPGEPSVSELAAAGVEITGDTRKVFASATVLCTCLPNSDIVEEILIGPAGLVHVDAAAVRTVLDFTTARPASTRKIAGLLSAKGIEMLDVPMTGGPPQAEEGKLNLAVGGREEVFQRMEPILRAVAANVFYTGPTGSGHALKIANNFLGTLDVCAASAVCRLTEKLGISSEALYDFVSVSGGNSWGFQRALNAIRAGTFDLSFALSLALKDLRYAVELFRDSGMQFAILDELEKTFGEAAEAGYGGKDLRAIYLYLSQDVWGGGPPKPD